LKETEFEQLSLGVEYDLPNAVHDVAVSEVQTAEFEKLGGVAKNFLISATA
jgi:hypothetical protein